MLVDMGYGNKRNCMDKSIEILLHNSWGKVQGSGGRNPMKKIVRCLIIVCLVLGGESALSFSGKGERGLTLVPLQVYFKGGKVKVELGLARGKTTYDKRRDLRDRDDRREIERARKGS